mmetsp:Transcript_105020/g.292498  ORF Transcript_105020/g.292498 Transcript_105020/m.292498 type:complete len:289 (+) Transcript_105020:34-900(+)
MRTAHASRGAPNGPTPPARSVRARPALASRELSARLEHRRPAYPLPVLARGPRRSHCARGRDVARSARPQDPGASRGPMRSNALAADEHARRCSCKVTCARHARSAELAGQAGSCWCWNAGAGDQYTRGPGVLPVRGQRLTRPPVGRRTRLCPVALQLANALLAEVCLLALRDHRGLLSPQPLQPVSQLRILPFCMLHQLLLLGRQAHHVLPLPLQHLGLGLQVTLGPLQELVRAPQHLQRAFLVVRHASEEGALLYKVAAVAPQREALKVHAAPLLLKAREALACLP